MGGGEGTILRSGGYYYHLIEAPDRSLACFTSPGEQNWVLGLLRSETWLPAGRWTPFSVMPTVMPVVKQGCYIQYHRLFADASRQDTVYLELWADNWMQIHKLVGGQAALPVVARPPPESTPNCTTKMSCAASCEDLVVCPSDGTMYCCADHVHCGGQHRCASQPELVGCACTRGR